jgi:hypothetical protein
VVVLGCSQYPPVKDWYILFGVCVNSKAPGQLSGERGESEREGEKE